PRSQLTASTVATSARPAAASSPRLPARPLWDGGRRRNECPGDVAAGSGEIPLVSPNPRFSHGALPTLPVVAFSRSSSPRLARGEFLDLEIALPQPGKSGGGNNDAKLADQVFAQEWLPPGFGGTKGGPKGGLIEPPPGQSPPELGSQEAQDAVG